MTPILIHLDAHMIDTRDGTQGVHVDECGYEYDGNYVPIYIWEDGNYSCDCNRSMFLYPNDGCPEYDGTDGEGNPYVGRCLTCSDDIIKVERLVLRETGDCVYSETGEPVADWPLPLDDSPSEPREDGFFLVHPAISEALFSRANTERVMPNEIIITKEDHA